MPRALKYQQICIFGLNNFTGMERIHISNEVSGLSLLPEGGYGGVYQRGVQTVEELRPVELDTNCALLSSYKNPGVARQSYLVQGVPQFVLQRFHCDPTEHFQLTAPYLHSALQTCFTLEKNTVINTQIQIVQLQLHIKYIQWTCHINIQDGIYFQHYIQFPR